MTSILDSMAIMSFTFAMGGEWCLTSDDMKWNENISCGGLREARDLTTEKNISPSYFTDKQQCTGEELLKGSGREIPANNSSGSNFRSWQGRSCGGGTQRWGVSSSAQ
jgi:hypothetical protein